MGILKSFFGNDDIDESEEIAKELKKLGLNNENDLKKAQSNFDLYTTQIMKDENENAFSGLKSVKNISEKAEKKSISKKTEKAKKIEEEREEELIK